MIFAIFDIRQRRRARSILWVLVELEQNLGRQRRETRESARFVRISQLARDPIPVGPITGKSAYVLFYSTDRYSCVGVRMTSFVNVLYIQAGFTRVVLLSIWLLFRSVESQARLELGGLGSDPDFISESFLELREKNNQWSSL